MLTIRRSFVPFAFVAFPLLMLPATRSLAADTEKPTLRSTPPSHVDAPSPPNKDHPTRVRPASSPQVAEKSQRDARDKVNINTADVKTLMTLTGVGRKVAEKIVEYRDNHGPFKKADELRKVDGVGNGVWEKNRERVVTK
jgi:competence ComEA-like helix-hairpin-helix protein